MVEDELVVVVEVLVVVDEHVLDEVVELLERCGLNKISPCSNSASSSLNGIEVVEVVMFHITFHHLWLNFKLHTTNRHA